MAILVVSKEVLLRNRGCMYILGNSVVSISRNEFTLAVSPDLKEDGCLEVLYLSE